MFGIRTAVRRLVTGQPAATVPAPKEAKWYLKSVGRGEGKVAHIQEACTRTRHLDGMIVECGVATGYTLSLFAHMTRRSGDARRIIGVDSFEGFSLGSEFDRPNFTPDELAHYRLFTEEFARSNLARSGLSDEEVASVELIKGWIPEVLDSLHGPISILHLDVDLYEPYRDSLKALWPQLQEGGVVLFDEYDLDKDTTKWPGAKRAIDEFCSENGLQIQKHWSGFAFLVK
jgi:O-methyltransferase